MTIEITKDASEDADWAVDWTPRGLGADTISSFTFEVFPAGLTADRPAHSATTTTLWLSGGAPGATYRVELVATTAAGRKIPETLVVFVEP